MDPHRRVGCFYVAFRTLAVRVQRQNENALRVAQFSRGTTPKWRCVELSLLGGDIHSVALGDGTDARRGAASLSFENRWHGEKMACHFCGSSGAVLLWRLALAVVGFAGDHFL